MTDDERLARVARGWDEAADGYEEYFVPRFAPWVKAAVDAIGDVPEGPVLVPCCGTFPELDLLAERFPDRAIAGIDLSAGMVRRARERAARLNLPGVEVVQGDASTLDPRWSESCAAVVSVFGLQQLPDPETAVRSWLDALRPGGQLCVVFWPETTEEAGPFALVASLVGERGDFSWEDRLAAVLGEVERDELVSYPMTHEGGASYFDAANHSGSMRALALARGDDFIARLRQQFLAQAPAGEWTHHPRARLIVVRKPLSRAEAAPPTS
ncbi:methyltransferase family protein [Kribbella antiqua]|uniref:Methyltransferase family protein n=1 Tax=Kribbella antiqua TaxID=2512217 RepID=A0A4R2IMM2_9ACTN|nr:methyltransferase domain-containing protein [Kribbella antiqua]TCO45772.1 methyltransferase family protein [Kribbella antiqua]